MRILLAFILTFIVGCTIDPNTGEKKIDPIATGEVIGYTYLLTKDQLKEQDRKSIELAYSVFTEVVKMSDDSYQEGDSMKALLFAVIDSKFDGNETQKNAAKMVVTLYWNRVQSKYNIDLLGAKDQMAILKQVHIGIERALGR